MTHAERLRDLVTRRRKFATDPVFNEYEDVTDACEAGADALDRLAQTCGNCQHADRSHVLNTWCYCAAPDVPAWVERYPFRYADMPLEERCKGWTKREDA